jgi:hypothetical protein
MGKVMLKAFLVSMFILGLTASVCAQPLLNTTNWHYYEVVYVNPPLTWNEAKNYAETLIFFNRQGHLATITSSSEQAFIDANFSGDDMWIGGYQLDNQSAPDVGWRWITGEPWSYTNWDDGEPNDYGSDGENNEENYLEAFYSVEADSVVWNDDDRYDTLDHILVEYDCTGSVCYVPCDPQKCSLSHCDVYLCGSPGTINVGQITYHSEPCAGLPPPSSCVVYIPLPGP